MGVHAAGGGPDQADADDAVAEQLGVLLGQRDDGHAAHRVADQHDRALGHGHVEHAQQVVAELLDVGVLLARPAGAAVGALVVEDGADQAAVGRALEVPRVLVERVAVHEDDGELGVPTARPHALAAGHRGVELVDLDVQGYAVVGDHGQRLGAERAERRAVPDPAAGDDAAPLGDAQDGAGRRDADRAGRDPEDPAGGAHCSTPS